MRPSARASTVEGAILDLHQTAGNRGVAAVLGAGSEAVVQRQPAKGSKNDGGTLTLGSEEAIPLQSATWSLKSTMALMQQGQQKHPMVHPVGLEAGELKLKRRPDKRSDDLPGLLSTEFEKGTLRLDRPSRDGAIPATNLDLRGPQVVSYTRDKSDAATETLTLGIEWMKVSGMGKDEDVTAKGKARTASRWELRTTPAGADPLPAVPLIAVSYEAPRDEMRVTGAAAPGDVRPVPQPLHATVTMHAGMALTRLAKAQTWGERLDLAFAIDGQDRLLLSGALVEEISSASDGPDVVRVRFIAEEHRRVAGGSSGGSAGKP